MSAGTRSCACGWVCVCWGCHLIFIIFRRSSFVNSPRKNNGHLPLYTLPMSQISSSERIYSGVRVLLSHYIYTGSGRAGVRAVRARYAVIWDFRTPEPVNQPLLGAPSSECSAFRPLLQLIHELIFSRLTRDYNYAENRWLTKLYFFLYFNYVFATVFVCCWVKCVCLFVVNISVFVCISFGFLRASTIYGPQMPQEIITKNPPVQMRYVNFLNKYEQIK